MESYRVIRCEKGLCQDGDHELIQEEPLLIHVDDKPYSVVMRTPGEEIAHAAGFCLGEGLVDNRNDFAAVGFCRDLDPNVVEVRIKPERREKVPDILERRGFVSQTSCGICGKEMVKDLYQTLIPAEHNIWIDIDKIFVCIDKLSENQAYYSTTRGSHAAMLVDSRLDTLSFAEDVGRHNALDKAHNALDKAHNALDKAHNALDKAHNALDKAHNALDKAHNALDKAHNALDKAIGKLLLGGNLRDAIMVILSSRISYELVQKAARARLPIMVSESRPTSLAVEMGQTLNMTLACTAKESELIIFCGEERIIRK